MAPRTRESSSNKSSECGYCDKFYRIAFSRAAHIRLSLLKLTYPVTIQTFRFGGLTLGLDAPRENKASDDQPISAPPGEYFSVSTRRGRSELKSYFERRLFFQTSTGRTAMQGGGRPSTTRTKARDAAGVLARTRRRRRVGDRVRARARAQVHVDEVGLSRHLRVLHTRQRGGDFTEERLDVETGLC